MASHGNSHRSTLADDKVTLGQSASGLKFGALGLGLVALVVAVVVSFFMAGDHAAASHAKFYHAYLVGISWCLSIALGGLFFTLMQHMVKVGWSVNIRRVPEALAATLPYLGILTIPLFIPVIGHKGGELYPWAVPHVVAAGHEAHASLPLPGEIADAEGAAARHVIAESSHDGEAEHEGGHVVGEQARFDYMKVDELTEAKAKWLNPTFFIVRVVAYFAIWTVIAGYYYAKSKKQDITGDVEISKHLAVIAPVSIIAFAVTLTFAAFDLIMSLDHHWFSTIFGVYVFAGGMIGMFATTIITFRYLQAKGLVTQSISTEHYHDLGKYLFAFVFFWGYIAFSQFMLQWYANLPEETMWWQRRGVTSADALVNTQGGTSGFAGLSLVLLFGHFLLPFAYLISRHIKRSKEALLFGAAWMLLAHLVDMYWLIMPEWNNGEWALDVAIVCAIVGVIGLFVFAFLQTLAGANLRPIGDPRANESLAFVNM